MSVHIGLGLSEVLCTVLTIWAIRKSGALQCFDNLEKQGGEVVAFFFSGSTALIIMYLLLAGRSAVGAGFYENIHMVVAMLICAMEAVILGVRVFKKRPSVELSKKTKGCFNNEV